MNMVEKGVGFMFSHHPGLYPEKEAWVSGEDKSRFCFFKGFNDTLGGKSHVVSRTLSAQKHDKRLLQEGTGSIREGSVHCPRENYNYCVWWWGLNGN